MQEIFNAQIIDKDGMLLMVSGPDCDKFGKPYPGQFFVSESAQRYVPREGATLEKIQAAVDEIRAELGRSLPVCSILKEGGVK